VNEVYEWLKKNLNGRVPHIRPHAPRRLLLASSSQTSKALVVLQQGRIRLIRSGSGGAKFFKVIA
jgi:hypothetical protein